MRTEGKEDTGTECTGTERRAHRTGRRAHRTGSRSLVRVSPSVSKQQYQGHVVHFQGLQSLVWIVTTTSHNTVWELNYQVCLLDHQGQDHPGSKSESTFLQCLQVLCSTLHQYITFHPEGKLINQMLRGRML